MTDKLVKDKTNAYYHTNDVLSLPFIRVLFAVFAILYSLFAAIDRVYFPDHWPLLWLLRFGLVVPLLVSTILLSYKRCFLKIYQPYVAINVFVGGGVIAIMLMMQPENIIYYGGLFMVFFSGYFIIRLRFWYASLTGWAIFFFYLFGSVLSGEGMGTTAFYAGFYFIGANLIGMLGLYYLESLQHKQWLRDREITYMHAQLKEAYEEKQKQLEQVEQFIEENKALQYEYREKHLLTERLKKTEERFEALAKQSQTFFYEMDITGKYTYISSSVEAILGYRSDEIVGRLYFYDLFPKAQRAHYQRLGFEILQKKAVLNVVNPLMTQSGQTIWVSSYVRPVLDEQGIVTAYRGSDMNITEKINAQETQKIFESMIEQAEYGAALSDLDGRLVFVNEAFCRMHGYTQDALLGQSLSKVHDKTQMPQVNRLNEMLRNEGKFGSTEVGHKKKDGTLFPTIMAATLLYQGNQPKYFSSTTVDITELKRVQTDLLDREKRYRLVSQLSNTGIWEYDLEIDYFWCSPEYFSMLNLDPKDYRLGPKNLQETWIDLIHPDDQEAAANQFRQFVREKPQTHYENQFRFKAKSGAYRWIWSRGSFIRDEAGIPTDTVIGTHIDITEQKNKELEIEHMSKHDDLTNIPNRHYFQERLAAQDQDNHYPLAIAIIDVNGLKLINDSFGHSTGNVVLKQVADVLERFKGPKDFVARIGGDEFVLICPNSDGDAMNLHKEKLNQIISKQRVEGLQYSLAFGYEVKKDRNQSIRDVLKEAENNMYKNKVIYGSSTRNLAVMTILQTLTTKYNEEKVHSEHVGQYCRQIGEAMQLREEELVELELAGKLHDIGKISIPDHILDKPGPLTEKEWKIMKEHTINGYQILRAADRYSNLAEYAMSHHERMDGQGYPNGIKGHEIPLYARIISVADAYEAMTADRCYRKGMKHVEARAELKKHAGTQFDPDIVAIFLNEVLKKRKVKKRG